MFRVITVALSIMLKNGKDTYSIENKRTKFGSKYFRYLICTLNSLLKYYCFCKKPIPINCYTEEKQERNAR